MMSTAAAWLSALATVAAEDPGSFTGELNLVLWRSLVRGPDDADAPHLVVETEAENGRWGRAFGLALHLSQGLHEGMVTRGAVTGDTFRLRLQMMMDRDPYGAKGGYGEYDIVAVRGRDGRMEGTFEGTFRGNKASGRVTGAVKPPRPVRTAVKPPEPEEHPRVLFRRSDLPALRERLKTPFGQAYLAKAGARKGLAPWDWDLINIGVLHQLTGGTNYAASARLIVERYLKDPEIFVSDRGAGSGGWGHSLVGTALALDLFWDAWPEDFRRTIEERFMAELPHLLRFVNVTSHPNPHPCSNYYGPGMGAPALAALVLWGGRGPEPAKPGDPLDRPRAIEPPADFVPGKGVPVVEFAPGRAPAEWLMAGPLAIFSSGDPLAFLGGCGRARPQEGVPIELLAMAGDAPKTARSAFRPLIRSEIDGTRGVDVEKLAGTNQTATIVLFAALKVTAEQVVGFCRNGPSVNVWLADTQVNETDYYRLAPGLYPFTVVYSAERAAGRIAPFFDLPAGESMKPRRGQHEMEMALWKLDHEYWTKTGGCDPKRDRLVWVGRQRCYQHYRLGVGDGGFQAETGWAYAGIATWYPLNFAVAYRKVFGRDASPYPDITHLAPRRLMQVAFRETAADRQGNPKDTLSTFHANRHTLHQFVNSITGIENVPCGDVLAAGFPIVPDEYRPAVLWAWNKVREVDPADPATAANVLSGAGLELALGFLHHPLDAGRGGSALQPEPPAKVMPRAWAADTFGHYTFRNGWRDENDFIAQVFAKSSPINAHNHANAGTFALLGLGHGWVNGALGKGNPNRAFEPVVLLPLDDTNEGGCGRVLHRAVQPDGSATITIDLNHVYAPSKTPLYDKNLLRVREITPSAISGLRAWAFDYSGKSGAPCLFAIVDKITGGQERWWQWTLDPETFAVTKAGEGTFTINRGDASLKATFVTPADARPEVRSEDFLVVAATANKPAQRWPLKYVRAPGRDHFFVVGTIQRGAAPEVRIEGAGLDAVVTVGGRTVRFDGEKLALGER